MNSNEHIKISEYQSEKIITSINNSLNDFVNSSNQKINNELIINNYSAKYTYRSRLAHYIGVWGICGDITYNIKYGRVYYIKISWSVTHQMILGNFTLYKKFDTYILSKEKERALKIEKLELL